MRVSLTQSGPSTDTVPERAFPLGKVAVGGLLLLVPCVVLLSDFSWEAMFATVKVNREWLLLYADRHYVVAVAVFIGVYCVLVALSLPGDVPLTLLGGFLFGSVAATLYVNIGATAGAVIAFVAARYLIREWVEARIGNRVRAYQEGFTTHAFSYLLTLRLIPVVPFVLINLVAGLTRMDLGTFVRATALGILPCSFVYAYAGRQLGQIDSPGEVASPSVLLALTLLGLLAVTPPLYRLLKKGAG